MLLCSTIDSLDKGRKISTIFMDLSKTFDTVNHNLLLAKLNTNGFFIQWGNIGSKLFLSYFIGSKLFLSYFIGSKLFV